MKKIWKKNLSVILAAALVFSGADCGNLSSVYAQENSAWEETLNDLAGETLSAEDESTSAPEETDVATEQSSAAEEITNALSEDTGTELASTEESVTEEIQKVNAVEVEDGTQIAATEETDEEEIETDEEEIAVNAESGEYQDNLKWSYDPESKTLTISGEGDMADYDRDNQTGAVTAPWKNSDCGGCENVIIEEGVTRIGRYAFYNFGSITSVSIPNSLKSIGIGAFWGCGGLVKIEIPGSATSESIDIDVEAFCACTGLRNVTIDRPVHIEDKAFNGCTSLEEASIRYADGASVANSTFLSCTSLNTITLKGNFSKIENLAFQYCYKLNTIRIPDGTPEICESLTGNDQGPFNGCSALINIDAPHGLGSIGAYAFYEKKLTSIKLSDKATTIGKNAFDNCTTLSSIDIPKNITSIGESAFSGCSGLKSVTFSPRDNQKQLTIGTYAFGWCGIEELEIPDNTTVSTSAFTTNAALKKLVIGNNVTLGQNAFNCQSNLEEIIFEKNVTIDNTAFENCESQYLMKLYKGTPAHTYAENSRKNYKYRVEQVQFTPDPDNKDPRELPVGEAQLQIELFPDTTGSNNDGIATIADKIEWQSSNPDIVSIDSSAPTTAEDKASVTVRALKEGISTITVNCDGKEASCTIKVMVPAKPVTASPESGSVIYSNSAENNTVTLACGTSGAVIYYTTDGSTPTKNSQQYKTPITFDGEKSSVTIKAFAAADEYLDSEVSTFTYTVKKKAEGIAINSPNLTMSINESRSLSVRFTPEGAEAETTPVTWKSSDEAVVSVTPGDSDTTTAQITAKSAGTCTITASYGSFTAACEVTVNETPSVSPVTAEPDSGEVPAGTTVTLRCGTQDADIYYTTDGSEPSAQNTRYEGSITINSDTTIKAVAIKSGYNDSETAVFTYTIKEEIIEITGISLDKNELKLGVDQKGSLTVGFQPENALPEKITWSSDKPSVAQVLADAADDATAEVTALAAGTCVITASCREFTAQCTVTVTEKECVPAVKAEPGAGAVEAGTKVSLLCDIPDAKIYYTTDNTTPTAQSSLYSTPIAIDKALTTKAFAVKEGYEHSAVSSFEYIIKNEQEIPVTGISLDKDELKLGVDQKGSLTVSFQPENALPEKITWSSDKPSVAQVLADAADDAKAEVTAQAAGSCVITASCGEFTAQCTVTVTEKECVPAVKAEPGSGAVAAGTKVSLLCDIPDAKIYYTTDNTTPTAQSTLYTTPIAIDKALTIKAFAVKEGYEDSAVSTFEYTIKNEQEIPVTGISLDRTSMEIGLEETGRLTVSFQPTDAAPQKITWTSDNTEIAVVAAETDNSASAKIIGKKSGQCTVTASCLTFTASCTVTVADEKRISVVYASPSSKSPVTPGTEVTLYCDTEGAAIYYTLDGTVPTTVGTHYSGPIMLLGDTTIKTYAVKEGYTDSPVSVFEFIVNDIVPDIPDIDPSKEGIWISDVADQTYTGSAIKPAVYVFDGQKLLTEKTDYTVSYKNNIKPGTGQIIITGKGNYTDKKTAEFTITKKDISGKDVIIEDMAYAYNGKIHKTAPTITHNGKKLKLNKDFEVTYGEGGYIEEGRYTLTIKGIGNYEGTADGSISIISKDKLINKASIAKIPSQQYNKGNEVTLPDSLIKVTLNRQTLQKDKDYTVDYANHTNPGKATIIITGIGEYAGTKKAVFSIIRTAVNMTNVTCTNSKSFEEMEFVKGGCTPVPVLTHDGYTLRAGTDYTVSYKNNKKAGAAAKLVVSGKGNFKGKKEISFTVSQKDISKVSMYTPNVPYTGKANKYQSKPVLVDSDGTRLKANTDYTLTFTEGGDALDKRSNPSENAVLTVHVKGKGNYCGERTDTYILSGTNFSTAKIQIQNKDFTGRAVTITEEDIKSASIKVAGTTIPLTYGKDFEAVSYSKNVKKGTASVILCGKGEYCGEKTVKFKIVSRNIKSE